MQLKKFLMAALCAVSTAALFADPIALRDKGNINLSDDMRWFELNNDFAKLPKGVTKLGGIDFDLGGEKAAILLGKMKYGITKKHSVDFVAQSGETLYVLNSFIRPTGKSDRICGTIVLRYEDGKVSKRKFIRYVDVSSWRGEARKAKNAVPVWSQYAISGTVELQITKIQLRPDSKLVGVDFVVANDAQWAILGLNVGTDRNIEALIKNLSVTGKFEPIKRFEKTDFDKIAKTGKPKNIIMIIGDGMGFGALNFTSSYLYGAQGMLPIEQFPIIGMAETYSANSDVTDSAASGTALSCGFKTNNSYIGQDVNHVSYRSIATEAHDSGRSVGLLTDDSIAGATPCAFGTHAKSRKMKKVLLDGYTTCGFDVLIGNTNVEFSDHQKSKMADYTFVKSLEDFNSAPEDKKVAGIMKYKDTLTLSLASKELFRRLSKNPKGFFCMIECSYPDGGGHGNKPDHTVRGVSVICNVAREAVAFAQTHPDTLIVITADHETGGIVLTQRMADGKAPFLYYQGSNHTGAPVPVFVVGPGSERFGKIMNNIEIPKIFADLFEVPLGRKFKVDPVFMDFGAKVNQK